MSTFILYHTHTQKKKRINSWRTSKEDVECVLGHFDLWPLSSTTCHITRHIYLIYHLGKFLSTIGKMRQEWTQFLF